MTPPPEKPGRPPIEPSKRRNTRVPVRVSAEDVKAIRKQAKMAGLTITQWVRERLNLPQ